MYYIVSKSRIRGRIYFKYFIKKDLVIKEGEGNFGNELWVRGGIFYKWFVKKIYVGRKYFFFSV